MNKHKGMEFFSRSQQLKRNLLFYHAGWQKCVDTGKDSSEAAQELPIFSLQISQDVAAPLMAIVNAPGTIGK